MKKNLSLLLIRYISTLTFLFVQPIMAQTSDLASQGSKFIDLLSAGDYKAAADMFDETMKKALPGEKT